ncbi:hypothetical protein XELAEV_18004327mg, partial [Xenopus laevis]
ISYGASDPLLSDRLTFPYFFRTVQSDHHYFSLLTELLKYFGWTWVGVIRIDDDNGDREFHLMNKYFSDNGICIEFSSKLNTKIDISTFLPYIFKHKEMLQKSTTSVIVLCGTVSTAIAEEFRMFSDVLRKKMLILPTNWATNHMMYYAIHVFNGSLGLIQKSWYDLNSPKVKDFLASIHPSKFPKDVLLEDIWRLNYFCYSANEYLYANSDNCTEEERFKDFWNFNNMLHSPRVYLAVSLLSHAIYKMFLSKPSPKHDKTLHNYKYQQWQQQRHSWETPHSKIPRAQCSDNCIPGFRKAPMQIPHVCCYDCVQCPVGEMSNTTDSENCIRCPDMEWPNEKMNQCIAKTLEFLSYTNDVISMLFSSFSVLFFLLTLLILGVFIAQCETPIVRANNRSLSFLLLVSIKLSFLSVFLFLGRPVDITCMLRNITFGITFSIAVSSLLAKTIMVCVAFKATKPGSSWRKWVGVKLSNSVVLFCSSIQIIICMTWLAISPPFQELDLHTYPGTIIIQCNEGSAIGFYSVIGYMGLLAAVSFVLAFLARTLPDSFNEAKYITFSMLLFCSVWITMIPAYLSTKGKNTVCVEIFAILTSSAGLLASIFLPKCYVILFKPEMNKKSHLLMNIFL